MSKKNIFLLALLVSLFDSSSPDEREDFHSWAAQYIPHVKYPDRYYEQWKRNKDHVEHHNSLKLGYTLKLNRFSHLAPEELFKQNIIVRGPPKNIHSANAQSLRDIPRKVDWRDKGMVTAVQYDACSKAIFIADTASSILGIKTGNLVPFSAEEIVDCCLYCSCDKDVGPFDCIQENGLCKDADYPYTSNMCMCHECNGNRLGVKGYHHVISGNETDLAVEVSKNPVMVLVDATQTSFQHYDSGIYSSTNCSTTKLNHALMVVGYSTNNEGVDYWICKNSWGAGWGNKGYIMIARNRNNMCGIATSASYPLI